MSAVNNNNNSNSAQITQGAQRARAAEIRDIILKVKQGVQFPTEHQKEGEKLLVDFLTRKIDALASIGPDKTRLDLVALQAKQQFHRFLADKKIDAKRDRDDVPVVFNTINEETARVAKIERRENMIQFLLQAKKELKLNGLSDDQIEALFKQVVREKKIEEKLPLIQKYHPEMTLALLVAKNDLNYSEILQECQQKQKAEDDRVLIRRSRPNLSMEYIDGLEEEAFYELLKECEEEDGVREEAKEALSELMDLAKIPQDKRELYEVTFQGSRIAGKVHQISVKNVLMGYSLHNYLVMIKLRQGEYQGDLNFEFTADEMKKLQEELTQCSYWAQDFKNIIKDFFDNGEHKIDDFVELGQKPCSEVFNDRKGWSTESFRSLMEFPGNSVIPLLGTLSLNLNRHPNKVQLRAEFVKLYNEAKLVGHNGKPKEFLVDDPFRSNLGIDQVMLICPQLNKLIKFKQLITEFSGEKDYYKAIDVLKNFYGMEDILEVMKQYKIGVLNEIDGQVRKNGQRDYQKIANTLSASQSIGMLEGASLKLCQQLLVEHSGVLVTPRAIPHEFTPQEVDALYKGAPTKQYEGARHRNLPQLLATLKESKGYQNVLKNQPHITEPINKIFENLVQRLNGYHRLTICPIFGKPPLDSSILVLEKMVVKIVNQEKSKVTDRSIERAMLELAGQQGQGFDGSCGEGLFGRINSAAIALQNSEGSEIDDHLNAFKQGCLDQAFQRAFGDNSHRGTQKEEVSKFVQVTPGASKSYAGLDDQSQSLLRAFLNEFTPTEVYHSVYEFLGTKFWEFNREKDDEAMYNLFQLLGFPFDRDTLDKKYRVNGDKNQPWQYTFFQQDLPQYLVKFLFDKRYLYKKDPSSVSFSLMKQEGREVVHAQITQRASQQVAQAPAPVAQPFLGGYQPAANIRPAPNDNNHS